VTNDLDWTHLLGDYDEIYYEIFVRRGRVAALLWVFRQIVNASLIHFGQSVFWRFIMLHNYFKIAVRNIRRQKLYSFINILGLAVGLTSSILIFLWVQDEKGYDDFHENAAQIYRVTIADDKSGPDDGFAVTPIAMVPVIKSEIPDILYAARTSVQRMTLSDGENEIREKGMFVSPDFLKMFSFRLLEGNPDEALSSPDKIVISEALAFRHFGSGEALGRILKTLNGSEFIVSGVFQDIPRQSHLYFDYMVNFRRLERHKQDLNRWTNITYY